MADFTALKTAIQNAIKQNGNEEITGNLLQEVLLAIVTTLGDGSINELITALGTEATTRGNADTTLQQNINAEALARGNADTALGGRIDGVVSSIEAINDAIENGYVYAGIATPSSTPASGKVFYLALTAGTYTNFNGLEVSQGINILKNNGSTWSLDSFVGIDDAPAPSSQKLVKSGGVFDEVMKNGSAFDLSAYNGGATYADLNAALTALNALPAAYKRGGMSMKFVQTSDNNYTQYRCISNEFTTDVKKWYKIDDSIIIINSFEQGGIDSSTGNETPTSYRIRTPYIPVNIAQDLFVQNLETNSCRIFGFCYNSNYEFISRFINNVSTFPYNIAFPSNTTYIRLVVGYRSNETDITPSDFAGIVADKNSFIACNVFIPTSSISKNSKKEISSGAIYELVNTAMPFNNFEQGGLDSTDGLETERTDRLRSYFIPINSSRACIIKSILSDFKLIVYFYDYQKGFISLTPRNTSINTTFPSNTAYIRILIVSNASGEVTPTDYTGVYMSALMVEPYINALQKPINGDIRPVSSDALYKETLITINDFEQGGIASGDGSETSRDDRIRTPYIQTNAAYPLDIIASNTENIKLFITAYDSNFEMIELIVNVLSSQLPYSVQLPTNTKYIRAAIGRINSANITPSDFSGLIINKNVFVGLSNYSHKEIQNGLSNLLEGIKRESLPVNGTFNLISRLGYRPYTGGNPPQSSIPSYLKAYQKGFRNMLIDVRVTSDGVFVSGHDDDIRGFGARNPDGTEIASPVLISTHTLAELDEYDFGIYRGAQYAGLKLLTIKDFLFFCKMRNLHACIEFKTNLSDSEFARLADLITDCGMAEDCTFRACISGGYPTQAEITRLHNAFPNAELWCGYPNLSSTYLNMVLALDVPSTNKYNMCLSTYAHTLEGIIQDLQENAETVINNGLYIWLSEFKAEDILALQTADVLKYIRNINTDDIDKVKEYLYDGQI